MYPFAALLSTSELKATAPATALAFLVPPVKFEPPVAAALSDTFPVKFSATLLFASRACTWTLNASPARTFAIASTARCVAVTLKALLTPLISPALDAVIV